MKKIDPAELANLLRHSKYAVALTGAGISVDSGIPSFRGAQGLWAHYDPMEYAHIQAFVSQPAKVWKMLLELDATISQARPNPAHLALAELEQQGLLHGIVTQNVDNLHQEAGSRLVVEFHGNAKRFRCLKCAREFSRQELNFSALPLHCPCQGLIKPDVVFFGEEIPAAAHQSAWDLAERTDLMLVIGTSAAVVPASYLPRTAKQHGAAIVEINLETTDLSRRVTDYFLQGSAGQILPLTLSALAAG